MGRRVEDVREVTGPDLTAFHAIVCNWHLLRESKSYWSTSNQSAKI